MPPVIRKLQLQSATLAAAASISAHEGREQDIGTAAGDRRPPSALFFERYLRVRGHTAPQSTVFAGFCCMITLRPGPRSAAHDATDGAAILKQDGGFSRHLARDGTFVNDDARSQWKDVKVEMVLLEYLRRVKWVDDLGMCARWMLSAVG